MAKNKTEFTNESVEDYLAARASDAQREDCRQLMAMMARVTQQSPRMWGPSIVGYGEFTFRTDAGRTGQSPLAAFAIRGRDLVVYMDCDALMDKSLLEKVGKYKAGKSCFYFRQLADLDQAVLEKMIVKSIADATQKGL